MRNAQTVRILSLLLVVGVSVYFLVRTSTSDSASPLASVNYLGLGVVVLGLLAAALIFRRGAEPRTSGRHLSRNA